MLSKYQALVAEKKLNADAAQFAVAEQLDILYQQLIEFKAARNNRLKRLLQTPKLPQGIYLWGGVGRGKSMLMDCFYSSLDYRRKRRVHFHQFMREVHNEINQLKGNSDPLLVIAKNIAKSYRLLCFDEFHVSDIADAMILGRLLQGLFDAGVVLVLTSNYPPHNLYPDGLKREHFLPTITLLENKLKIFNLDSVMDYRRRSLELVDIYHTPLDDSAEKKLVKYCQSMYSGTKQLQAPPKTINYLEVNGHRLSYRWLNQQIIWCDFKHLCADNHSQNDYLYLAERFHTVILSNVKKLSAQDSDQARRFTWLIDVLYDQKIKLIITAEVAPADIYCEGRQASEFQRSVSRLMEMQSQEYLDAEKV